MLNSTISNFLCLKEIGILTYTQIEISTRSLWRRNGMDSSLFHWKEMQVHHFYAQVTAGPNFCDSNSQLSQIWNQMLKSKQTVNIFFASNCLIHLPS